MGPTPPQGVPHTQSLTISVQRADPDTAGIPINRKLLNGFPRTSRFIAADPDKTTAIFRRFDEISVRNLLYLEGRIAALESVQKRLDNEDFNDNRENQDVTLAACSWEEFALLGSQSDHSQIRIPKVALEVWKTDRLNRQIFVKERERRVQTVPAAILLRSLGYGSKDREGSTELQTQAAPITSQRSSEHNGTRLEEGLSTTSQDKPAVEDSRGIEIGRPSNPAAPPEEVSTSGDLLQEETSVQPLHRYAKELGCDAESLKMIRQRWDLAEAIEESVKEYRKPHHDAYPWHITELRQKRHFSVIGTC